jgi:hypothetical protein
MCGLAVGLPASALLAVLPLLLFPGCTEDVTAVLGTERPFSIYGVLNPRSDTQWVRVFPVEGTLLPETGAPLDAQLTSLDLRTGEEWVWRDSLVQYANGSRGHVFWAPFRAEYEHDYRLELRRSDGATSRVTVDVPALTTIVLLEPTLHPPVLHVAFPGAVPRLIRVRIEYWIRIREEGDGSTMPVVLISDLHVRHTAEGWRVLINLRQDFSEIINYVSALGLYDNTHGIVLMGMTLSALVASHDWDPPGGDFDPNLLVEPHVMSNVENGFGFVGAGYRIERSWNPPGEIAVAAGFRPFE